MKKMMAVLQSLLDIFSDEEDMMFESLFVPVSRIAKSDDGWEEQPQKTEKSSNTGEITKQKKKPTIKKANPYKIAIHIHDITEGNRQAKYNEFIKCLSGLIPRYIADDGTRKLGKMEIRLKDFSTDRVNKALRTIAFSLGVPNKAAKGEAFSFKAQEDLADKWAAIFASLVRETYDFITDYLSLPQVTIMSKANLTHKGKALYSPETGKPIKQADWNKFTKNLEDFLNRKTEDLGNRIVLDGEALGSILDRMLKYNTLDAVKNARLDDLKYHGKKFDWIADDIKNLKTALGEPLSRMEAARVQAMQMSAAQRITKMTADMKESAKQILIDGTRNRQGATQVSQALFDKFVGLNSNYQRIAETEIQNAVNSAIINEEVHNAKEGEKVYFQRVEIVDANTCDFCKRMNGKIAVWSDTPLSNEKVKDEHAEFAIWEGKEWTGGKQIAAVGCFHPYCRGFWTRWTPEGAAADAYTAEIFKRGDKWKDAVETAKKEYKNRGIENPDDRTKGFKERVEELFAGTVKKSFTEEEHPRSENGQFTSKGDEAQGSGKKPKEKAQSKIDSKAIVELGNLLNHIHEEIMTEEEQAEVDKIIKETKWKKEQRPNKNVLYIHPNKENIMGKDAFKHEIKHARLFADMGYTVHLPAEKGGYKQKSYDAIINGVKVELKYITGKAKNIGNRYSDGLEQCDNVSFFISNKAPSKKSEYIGELKNKAEKTDKHAGALIVYFQSDSSIVTFDFSKEDIDIEKSALKRTLFGVGRAETTALNRTGSTSPPRRVSGNQTIRTERLSPNKNSLICKAYFVNRELNIIDEFFVKV